MYLDLLPGSPNELTWQNVPFTTHSLFKGLAHSLGVKSQRTPGLVHGTIVKWALRQKNL